ncbi:MAG: hypothetical protein IIA45_04745 [Bacteroidetes bacterium]|nr:hypothetical protein [Bacteroidota bacterium]
MNHLKVIWSYALCMLYLINGVYAQPGTLDTSFDPGYGGNFSIWTVGYQSNGKIIYGGYFSLFDSI